MGKKFWAFWKKFAHRLAIIQTTIILTLFYFLMISVFALVIKLLRKDLLDKKWKQKKSFWKGKEKLSVAIENARRQF
ncbi:MAG: hypothetical protein RBG1_1C00001G0678 [candidate division Zixibacteria bacterium RBG-1]|nr:MAG: hypothetical protein RBG1_1C00001G0678 [candidate division Zixibacteria bacterium RBG-1]OGC85914.1 MAG: hypothetical protein A2V73_08160 [candidate division Zixibacteria bacterium RBG_19FT_COMBO_42_43]